MADRILETGQVTEPNDWYAFQDANAPDRRLDGDPTPVPSVSGGRGNLKLEDWHQPFHLRFRLVSIGGVVLSVMWLWASNTFIENQLGWDNLVQLLPHELAGIVVGVLTPLALLWMVVAFLNVAPISPRDGNVKVAFAAVNFSV